MVQVRHLFDDLSNVVERIQENYSSERLFQTVDYFLYDAAQLVMDATHLYEEVLAIVYAVETRKKLHNLDDEDLFEHLFFRFQHEREIENKVDLVRSMKLNRELVLMPIQIMAEITDDYMDNFMSGSPANYYLRQQLKVKNLGKDMTLHLIRIRQSYLRYIEMRDAIVEKFCRLIVKDIMRYKEMMRNRIDTEDMGVEYFISMLRAFAKFDITSGTFTSYLKQWFMNARSTSLTVDEVGITHQIPHSVKTQLAKGLRKDINNFNVTTGEEHAKIEDITVQMDINQERQIIRDLVSACDPKGYYSILHEIEVDLVSKFNLA